MSNEDKVRAMVFFGILAGAGAGVAFADVHALHRLLGGLLTVTALASAIVCEFSGGDDNGS